MQTLREVYNINIFSVIGTRKRNYKAKLLWPLPEYELFGSIKGIVLSELWYFYYLIQHSQDCIALCCLLGVWEREILLEPHPAFPGSDLPSDRKSWKGFPIFPILHFSECSDLRDGGEWWQIPVQSCRCICSMTCITGRGGADLSLLICNRTQENGMKLCKGKLRLDIRKMFFNERLVIHWNRFPRKVSEYSQCFS